MDIDGAIANTEDLLRLHKLEQEGHFPAGYAVESMQAVLRYLQRVIALKKAFELIPYVGPTQR